MPFLDDYIMMNDEGGSKNSGFVIVGMPGQPVENLSFKSIHAIFPAGGAAEDATDEMADSCRKISAIAGRKSVSCKKFKRTGLFVHHPKCITRHNIQFETKNPDARPAIVFEDVSYVKTNDAALNR